MKKASSGRSSLLLIEIILSVLFFSLSSAVCLQMFVRASLLGRETEALDVAVRHAVSVAELLSRPNHTAEDVKTLYPEALVEDQNASVWFDQDFRPCGREKAVYEMKIVSALQDAHTVAWSVAVYGENAATIYSLEGTAYQQYTLPELPEKIIK